MLQYELPDPQETQPGFLKRHGRWLIPLLVLDAIFFIWWIKRDDTPAVATQPEIQNIAAPAEQTNLVENAAPPTLGLIFSYPTGQHQLLDTNTPGIYMTTGSGRPESGMYGSVRSAQQGKFVLPSFHEGLDIAPLGRDRSQRPTDVALAAADGRVAYFNKIAGNSNYGKYVILMHNDPVGEIYTLYAHLSQVDPNLSFGKIISRGEPVGIMGNTASTGIPIGRAHLHFETGMMLNRNFNRWFKSQRLKPDHGNYHGHNLCGVNPLEVFRMQDKEGHFRMADYLALVDPAFTLVIKAGQLPDYFVRYPGLWSGGNATGGSMVMTVSEGGVPLSGRPATETERTALAGRRHQVLSVNESVLGRNGLRLVTKKQNQWILGQNGEHWLEVLTYH